MLKANNIKKVNFPTKSHKKKVLNFIQFLFLKKHKINRKNVIRKEKSEKNMCLEKFN